jgi:hypothetical protein
MAHLREQCSYESLTESSNYKTLFFLKKTFRQLHDAQALNFIQEKNINLSMQHRKQS